MTDHADDEPVPASPLYGFAERDRGCTLFIPNASAGRSSTLEAVAATWHGATWDVRTTDDEGQ
jgi:hypothetical protein